jgi:hypothetical protein
MPRHFVGNPYLAHFWHSEDERWLRSEDGGKYLVRIRKVSYPVITKSFSRGSVAKKWVKATDADMEMRSPIVILTLSPLVNF